MICKAQLYILETDRIFINRCAPEFGGDTRFPVDAQAGFQFSASTDLLSLNQRHAPHWVTKFAVERNESKIHKTGGLVI
jgi:hypothetical protein